MNTTNTIVTHQDKTGFRYLYVLAMLFLTVMLCDAVTVYKLVDMPFGYTSACAYVFPLWFVLSDIITEVYGQRIARRILWSAFFCEIVFSLACYFLVKLDSPAFWQYQDAFELILGHLPRIIFSSSVAILVSGYLNIYFISKWKIMLRGKYFWLRSIGSSWIGEFFYTFISIFFMMYGMLTFKGLMTAIAWSYLIKAVCTVILAFPANVVATFLKIKEGTDVYDAYNPFEKKGS